MTPVDSGSVDKNIKIRQTANSEAIKNITRLVIFSSLSNIISNTPFTILYILDHSVISQSQVTQLVNVASILLLCGPACDIFIYFFYNIHFRDIFKIYFNSSIVKIKSIFS